MTRILLAVACVLVVAGCSLEYNQVDEDGSDSSDSPDTVLYDVTNTIVSENVPRFIVRADRAETYGDLSLQKLEGITFTELDASGALRTEGSALLAEYETDTEDVTISGNVQFYSADQDAYLSAEVLYWDNDERRLTSEPADTVGLRRGDGTAVRGRGFVAEMGRSIIRFEDGVSGTIIESSEE